MLVVKAFCRLARSKPVWMIAPCYPNQKHRGDMSWALGKTNVSFFLCKQCRSLAPPPVCNSIERVRLFRAPCLHQMSLAKTECGASHDLWFWPIEPLWAYCLLGWSLLQVLMERSLNLVDRLPETSLDKWIPREGSLLWNPQFASLCACHVRGSTPLLLLAPNSRTIHRRQK